VQKLGFITIKILISNKVELAAIKMENTLNFNSEARYSPVCESIV
jgi:hypothetical protein